MWRVKEVLAIVCLAGNISSERVEVFKSTLPVGNVQSMSGLQLMTDKDNVDLNRKFGFSLCARFNFKRLLLSKSTIVRIGTVSDWHLAFVFPGYQSSFIAFGNWDEYGSTPGWILQEKGSSDFMLWSTNRWHHICLSYKTSTSHITLVKVKQDVLSQLWR